MCWTEADLYGPATEKKTIDGNHVKRGQTTHLVSLQVLFIHIKTPFFKASQESRKFWSSCQRTLQMHAPKEQRRR